MNAVRITLIVLDAFVGLTAIGGGIALATGLEGERYPVAWLRQTPFSTYVIPGLILALAVGGSAALATVATLARPEVGAWISILAGAILMGQIVGEILLLRRPVTGIEVAYFATPACRTRRLPTSSGPAATSLYPRGEGRTRQVARRCPALQSTPAAGHGGAGSIRRAAGGRRAPARQYAPDKEPLWRRDARIPGG
jgi:hypothetical protein